MRDSVAVRPICAETRVLGAYECSGKVSAQRMNSSCLCRVELETEGLVGRTERKVSFPFHMFEFCACFVLKQLRE